MYIDRRYRGRQRKSPWPMVAIVLALGAGLYALGMRANLVANPLKRPQPTPTPTRTALSHLVEAEDHYKAGRLVEATTAYERAARLEPDNDEAAAWQSRLWILRGHPATALETARQAAGIKSSATNLAVLAMALDWNEQYSEAMETALKAVDKDPVLAEAHATLAEVYADKNNWNRALEEAQTAVKLKPNSGLVQRDLGYVLERQGRFKEAIQAYEKAAQIEPQLNYAHLGAGNSYMALGDYPNALAWFQRAIDATPDSPVGYDALGHASATSGDPDRAISLLRKAIAVDPGFGPAYAHLGRVYYTRLNWEAAIEYFKQAVDLGVRNEEYLYEFGLSYVYLNDCKNAVIWLQKALEVNPQSKPAQDGLSLCARG